MGLGNPEMVGNALDVAALRNQKRTLEADMTEISAGMPLADPLRGYEDMGVKTGEWDRMRYAEMYQRRAGRFTPAKYLKWRSLVQGEEREMMPMDLCYKVMGYNPDPWRKEAERLRPEYQQARAECEKANPEWSLGAELGRIGADFKEGMRLLLGRAVSVLKVKPLNPSHQE